MVGVRFSGVQAFDFVAQVPSELPNVRVRRLIEMLRRLKMGSCFAQNSGVSPDGKVDAWFLCCSLQAFFAKTQSGMAGNDVLNRTFGTEVALPVPTDSFE